MTESNHRDLIKANRVFLVENIDVLNTSIFDQLVQDGVLSTEQMTGIKGTCKSNLQSVSALLDVLHRKDQGQWSTFLKCLSISGHQHVLDKLAYPATAGVMEVEITDLQNKMVTIIKNFYDYVPLWTLHSDRVAIPMDEIYVSLVLIKERLRKHTREEPLESYKEILTKEPGRRTIYLTGDPGVGKSTLVKRICVDWAVGKKDRAIDEGILDHYLFVLPIFLRDIQEGQGFLQVISSEYQLRDTEAAALVRCIENTPMPILILLDGIDEYNEATSTEITEIIHRKRLQHITLFITSRYSSDSVYGSEDPGRSVEVRLRGFSEAGVKEYIKRYFCGREEEGEELVGKILKTEELAHLSHVPSILLMMVTLWEENQKLPNTVTGFYEEFVAYVFARMEKKHKKLGERAKTTEELMKRYHRHVMALGRLATSNMKTQRLELKFKIADVLKHITSDELKTGFLVEHHTFSRERYYLFLHKSVQEFFLSFYLVHSEKSTQKELLMQVFNSRQAFIESAMIRRFVAGLGGKDIQDQIKTLLVGDEHQVAGMHTDLQLEYMSEHQDAELKLSGGVRLVISNRYPASHYVRYLSQEGDDVKSMWVASGDVRHFRLLQHLNAPGLTFLKLDWSMRSPCTVDKHYITHTLDQTLKNFPLQQLTVTYLRDKNEMSALMKAVAEKPTLRELSLYRTPLTDFDIQTLKNWLPNSNLTTLTLSSCQITVTELTVLFCSMPQSLHTLDVSRNKVWNLTEKVQVAALASSRLQALDISDCHLTPFGILTVIDAIPETLTELDVRDNCRWEKGDDFVMLTERATRLKNMIRLDMRGNNMPSEVTVNLKQKLTQICPHLELLTDCHEPAQGLMIPPVAKKKRDN